MSAARMLADRDVRRVVAAAALMTSDKDGEVVAAARATNRLLAPHSLGLADVVAAGLDAVSTRGAMRSPASGMQPVTPLRPHQLQARMCLAYPELLTDWEREFAASVADQRTLSDKQRDRLNAIAVKVERGRN